MRLALIAACLLVVVAVTISPSSGNPEPRIKDRFKGVNEKIKAFVKPYINPFKGVIVSNKGVKDRSKTVKGQFKSFFDRLRGKWRGRRDVDFESLGTSGSDLRAILDKVSALEDPSDILSSVENVHNIVEGGSFKDDESDLEDSEDDETAEDVDNVDNVDGEDAENGGGESEEGDEESGEKGDEESEEKGDEEGGEKGIESVETGDENHVREEAEDGNGDDVVEAIERV